MDNDALFNTLASLGAALYLHEKLAEDAEKAAEAVRYLQEKGALEECIK